MKTEKLYKEIADRLANEVNRQFFHNTRSWYWERDEHGNAACFFFEGGCHDRMTADEMVLAVKYHMTHGEWVEWCLANEHHARKHHIGLNWWLQGVRHSMVI